MHLWCLLTVLCTSTVFAQLTPTRPLATTALLTPGTKLVEALSTVQRTVQNTVTNTVAIPNGVIFPRDHETTTTISLGITISAPSNSTPIFLPTPSPTHSPIFSTTTSPISASPTNDIREPRFSILPHPSHRQRILQINYERNAAYSKYQANYSDISALPNGRQGASGSVFLTGENPFNIFNLAPGHEYKFEIYGASSTTETMSLLHTQIAMTDPKSPVFGDDDTAIVINEENISLMGQKSPHALQDYFLVECSQMDPFKQYDHINVTDIPEQNKVELYIGNLNAGRNYNLTVSAFKNGVQSLPWQKIVTTKPRRPLNPRISKHESTSLVIEWDSPLKSGVDRYHVTYQPVPPSLPKPGSTIDIKNVEDTSVSLDSDLFPGDSYQFAIYSMKSNEASQPTLAQVTMKPLPPTGISVAPDYSARKFLVSVQLPSSNLTRFDRCYLQYLSENSSDLHPLNETSNILPSLNQCHFLISFAPGVAYRFSAWTLSGDTPSLMYANRTVIRPAFDPGLFGLQASAIGSHTVLVSWHQDHLLSLYWPALVGSESNLTAQLSGPSLLSPLLSMGSPLNTDASGGASAGLTFHNLPPGACFHVLAYTATPSGIVSINRSQTVVRTDPPRASIQIDSIDQDSVNLTVQMHDPKLQPGDDCSINLLLLNESGHVVLNRTVFPLPRHQAQLLIPLRGLQPFARYHVRSVMECGGPAAPRPVRPSDPICPPTHRNASSFSFETAQGRPGPVQNLHTTPNSPYEVRINWSPPLQPNGVVDSYIMIITPIDGNTIEPWNVTVPGNEHAAAITNMTGGNSYYIDVRAVTKAGLGQSSNAGGIFSGDESVDNQGVRLQMPLWAPPRPSSPPEILEKTVRKTDFSVRFNLSSLSTRHGLLQKYAIIVVEADAVSNAHNITHAMSWKDVQEYSVWPPYIAVEKSLQRSKHLNPVTVTEVIGVESDCSSATQHRRNVRLSFGGTRLCNGPLRPSKTYRVKLRAYTADDLFTDSIYSPQITLEAASGVNGGTIVAIVVTVVACICLCTVLAIFVKRNRGSTNSTSCSKMVSSPTDCFKKFSMDNATKLMPSFGQNHRRSKSLRERTGVDARLEKLNPNGHRFALPPVPTVSRGANYERSRPVRKADFGEHVRLMSADSDFRFSEEYEDLKQVGRSQPCSAAEIACNRNKNRFTNVLPFDHSRVKLVPVDDEEGSDYVNANYIPGYNSPREFIAAQGPLPSTRDDFWRMTWEQQCPAVVNLTRCVEKGREKCDMYWPADGEQVVTYGDIEVTVMNETRHPDWNMRELRLSHMGEPGVAPRLVKHYHYFAWPDFGVPDRPQSLVRFVRYFRVNTPIQLAHRPSIIHCSAGVGRSGTFIALDRLLTSILRDDSVDIFGMVYEMRKERVSMVQTEQQYICIHQCLLCVLDGREHDPGTPPSARLPPAAVYPRAVGPPILAARPMDYRPPRIEIHQNPAFEDDEGIAESGV